MGSTFAHGSGVQTINPTSSIPDTLRLLYVNSHFRRTDMWTGVRARHLVDSIANHGVLVSTFPPSTKKSGSRATTTKKMGGIKNFVRDKLPTGLAIWIIEGWLILSGALYSLRNALWAISIRGNANADVILIRAQEYDWTPWLIGKILGLPVVQEIHSVTYVGRSQRRGKPIGAHSGPLSRLEAAQWRSAAGMWANSPELISIILENGVAAERLHFVPFGVAESIRQFPGERPEQEQVRIAFVGSFYPWHGVQALIRAFSNLAREIPGASLVLMGDGIMRAKCEAEVNDLGLADRVEFTGWLTRDHMVERLRSVHIGVAPYLLVEKFYFEPVKIYDYMAAGLPIIASAQGRVTDMIEDGVSGCLVPPGDEAALTRELLRLCADRDVRTRLGAVARQQYLDHYTLDQTASRVREVCADAVRELVPSTRR